MIDMDYSDLIEQFRLEMDAYCRYKELLHKYDSHLKAALKEIMWDEYLHAKFLRNYLMKSGAYTPEEHYELERQFRRIENDA